MLKAERKLLHSNCIFIFPLVGFSRNCWNLTRLLGTVSVGLCLSVRRTKESNPGLRTENQCSQICTDLHLLLIMWLLPHRSIMEIRKYQDNKKDVCRMKWVSKLNEFCPAFFSSNSPSYRLWFCISLTRL